MNVGPCAQATEKHHRLLSLVVLLHLVGHNQRHFRNIVDQMSLRIKRKYVNICKATTYLANFLSGRFQGLTGIGHNSSETQETHLFIIIILRLEFKKKIANKFANTFRHDQRRDARGGNSRAQSVALLVDVDLTVPAAPCLGRCEHATTTAHVAVSTLAGAVSTATTDTGNTGHSTTGTPRFSTSLMTYNEEIFFLNCGLTF